MNSDTPLPKPMVADPKQPKAVEQYLKVMRQVADPRDQSEIFWWTRMDEDQLMRVMQKFCWDNSIDYNTVNWGKFLRGDNIPEWIYFIGGYMTKELPEWRRRALADPNLPANKVEVLMNGPKCLTDAWFLQAMRYKYQIRGYEN